MSICNGYPDIATVPSVGSCCGGEAFKAINKLPTAYPQVLSAENLQEAYGYTVDDFNLPESSWYVFSYDISGSQSVELGTVESTCSATPVDAETDGRYYSYYSTVLALQSNRAWIVEPLTCTDPTKGITKGPATLIIGDMSILPSPTVTPATPVQVRVNNPWHNVLRASANNILYSNPPNSTCRSGKWRLVYEHTGAFPNIRWECEDREDSSSSSRPSGSSGSAYCKNLSLDVKLVGVKNRVTVSELNRIGYSGLCFLSITYSWTGTSDFTGDDLIIGVEKSCNNEICPKVYATLSRGVGGDTVAEHSMQALGAITPPGITVRKKEIHQQIYLLALACESPKDAEDYAPCCADRADNGIGETDIVFTVSATGCNITKQLVLTVACDEEEDDWEQGQYTADVFFRDSTKEVTLLSIGECGEPITGSARVYLCANLITTGAYCSCDETVPIQLSGSGVSVEGPDYLTIPKGVYTDTSIPLSVPITIKGNGKDCHGTVSATVFGITVELEVNGEECSCKEPEEPNIDIKGSEYIGVSSETDEETGKVTYTIFIKPDKLSPCEEEDTEEDDDDDDDDELEQNFGEYGNEGNPTNPTADDDVDEE